jgi:hypothetical protein
MSTKTKLIILSVLMALSVGSTAVADKLCLQTTVNKKTFKVTNKSVVAATCPKGYTALADTSTFQGPAGSQGPSGSQGPAGIVNLAACRVVSNLCNLNTAGNCDVFCADQEFVLQYTSNNSGSCIVTNLTTNYFTYTNGVGYGVRQGTATITNGSCSYSNLLNAICCPVY